MPPSPVVEQLQWYSSQIPIKDVLRYGHTTVEAAQPKSTVQLYFTVLLIKPAMNFVKLEFLIRRAAFRNLDCSLLPAACPYHILCFLLWSYIRNYAWGRNHSSIHGEMNRNRKEKRTDKMSPIFEVLRFRTNSQKCAMQNHPPLLNPTNSPKPWLHPHPPERSLLCSRAAAEYSR